jgi:hypothetical protein
LVEEVECFVSVTPGERERASRMENVLPASGDGTDSGIRVCSVENAGEGFSVKSGAIARPRRLCSLVEPVEK